MRAFTAQSLRFANRLPSQPGLRAVLRLGARELLQHREVAGAPIAGPETVPVRLYGVVFLEEIPAAQHGEFEAGEVDVGAQAVLVPVAAARP